MALTKKSSSSQRATRTRRSGANTRSNGRGSTGLKSLTAAQKKEIAYLKRMPDSEIDYTDIPPLRGDFWKNAIRDPRVNKQQVSVRLDQDVFAWLKGKGKGYQTKLNTLLRQVMLADLRRRA